MDMRRKRVTSEFNEEGIKRALQTLGCDDKWSVIQEDWGFSIYFDGSYVLSSSAYTIEGVVKEVRSYIYEEIANEKRCVEQLSKDFVVDVEYAHLVEKRYGLYKD